MSGPGRTIPIARPTSLARASPNGVSRPEATTGPRSSGRATLVGVTVARPRRRAVVVAAASVGVAVAVAAAVAVAIEVAEVGAGAVAGGRRQIDWVGLVGAQHAAPLFFWMHILPP